MAKVFISYRRADGAYAAHAIYDKLAAHYGAESVVFDVDTIPLGADFVEYLNDQVSQCDALLAIIGDGWLDARSEDGSRRLDDPDDFVRIEIEAALKRKISVVPVLTGQASMPKKETLPRSLKTIARRNATEVRSGRGFQSHLDLLVRDLDHMFDQLKATPTTRQQKATKEKPANASPPTSTTSPKTAKRSEKVVSARVTNSDDIITNSIGMQLKRIPAGAFMMGSPKTWFFFNENPQHRVRITNPFYLGVCAVIQEEFSQVMGNNRSHFKGGDRQPVETVSWNDAVKFCNTLSDREELQRYYRIDGEKVSVSGGNGYRLPTEAEWEYACRAGTTTKWSCGNEAKDLARVAWYSHSSGGQTHTVGTLKPNDFGLCDMHGNVWEWCWDWYGNYKTSEVENLTEPTSGHSRVLRGGSFYDGSAYCRSAVRNHGPPDNRSNVIGFRVSRTCY